MRGVHFALLHRSSVEKEHAGPKLEEVEEVASGNLASHLRLLVFRIYLDLQDVFRFSEKPISEAIRNQHNQT